MEIIKVNGYNEELAELKILEYHAVSKIKEAMDCPIASFISHIINLYISDCIVF